MAVAAEGDKTVPQNDVPVEGSQASPSTTSANPNLELEGKAEENALGPQQADTVDSVYLEGQVAGLSQGSGESCLRHRQPQQSASSPAAATSTACGAEPHSCILPPHTQLKTK